MEYDDEQRDAFFTAYVECALWSSTDNADDSGGEPLDANYGPEDIETETLKKMREECEDFLAHAFAALPGILDDWTPERAGHDFWLTRNRHGAGFWDRGKAHGAQLTDIAEVYGSVDLYIGDDSLIYQS